MRAALTELLPLPGPGDSRELIELSVTHARVPGAEATRMREALCGAGPRVAVLPARSTDTARRYVHRATEQPLAWDHFVVPITAGTGVLDGLVEGIRDLLEDVDVYDEETLREHERDFGPVVVIVPHPRTPTWSAPWTPRSRWACCSCSSSTATCWAPPAPTPCWTACRPGARRR